MLPRAMLLHLILVGLQLLGLQFCCTAASGNFGSVDAFLDPCDSNRAREWLESAGELVFSAESSLGRSTVNVTVHPFPAPLGHAEEDEEHSPPGRWSVLRFAGSGPDSLQSVARNTAVHVHGTQVWAMQPDCLAFEYTKTIASIVAGLIGLQPHIKAAVTPPISSVPHQWRMLFLGLGGGTMPLFFSHTFPALAIDIVEIDAIVIKAASQIMGFPLDRPGMTVHHADAAAFIKEVAEEGHSYDFIILDAFNGSNALAPGLLTKGFLEDLAVVLHPYHGSLIMNMHCTPSADDVASRPTRPLLRARKEAQMGFDPAARLGAEIVRVSTLLREVLLRNSQHDRGAAFVVRAMLHYNVAVTISRGVMLAGPVPRAQRVLREAADGIAQRSHYPFEAGLRAQNMMWFVPSAGQLSTP